MIGSLAGDIIGSVYETRNYKRTDFPLFRQESRFTDDTVLTVALAESLLDGTPYVECLKQYYCRWPNAGYGLRFIRWARSSSRVPYNSWGNGSAMRVSPVAFAFDDLETVLEAAESSAAVTHNHPEGIRGAQAIAAAVFLARTGCSQPEIRELVRTRFGYPLERTLDEIRPEYRFDGSCQGTVPVAVTAFLESDGFEDAVRKAVSVGGDSDTIACITGGIAHAAYGVPPEIVRRVEEYLHPELWAVVHRFCTRYECL